MKLNEYFVSIDIENFIFIVIYYYYIQRSLQILYLLLKNLFNF
jgi:hypothetical protein